VISSGALVAGLLFFSAPGKIDGPLREATRDEVPYAAQIALKGFALASGTRILFMMAAIVGAAIAIRCREWRPGTALVAAIVGATLSADLLKSLFDRPSPEEWAAGRELGTAFPSGHAAVAVSAWGLIAILAGRRLPPATAISVAVVAAGMLAGALVSRVLLGDHWASDVLAGIGLGGLWVCVGAEICTMAPRHLQRSEGRLRAQVSERGAGGPVPHPGGLSRMSRRAVR
jgi:undecaprenyl-diphosphatase